jgi:ribonuclease P protein component
MKTKDIQTVYRRGMKAHHPLFRLLALPATQPTSRYAVVVSTKVSKRAVDRNRIKRQVRPILRKTLHNIKPHDLVVIAQTQANRADTKTITIALQQLFKKAHLL